jgi:hypothetical protein
VTVAFQYEWPVSFLKKVHIFQMLEWAQNPGKKIDELNGFESPRTPPAAMPLRC